MLTSTDGFRSIQVNSIFAVFRYSARTTKTVTLLTILEAFFIHKMSMIDELQDYGTSQSARTSTSREDVRRFRVAHRPLRNHDIEKISTCFPNDIVWRQQLRATACAGDKCSHNTFHCLSSATSPGTELGRTRSAARGSARARFRQWGGAEC